MPKIKDLTGSKFGLWTILSFDRVSNGNYFWNCKCDCGTIKSITIYNVTAGRSKSCGCLNLKDFTGKRYGKLTVIGLSKLSKREKIWECICDCGVSKNIYGTSLTSGDTTSCGCYRREMHTTHGHTSNKTQTDSWKVWSKLTQRCTDSKSKNYHRYGGRGITVCNDWLKFENFYKDMGDRPIGKSLDRINNDLGYCKENCRWATDKEQQNNRGNNRILEFKGITKTLSQWSEYLSISYTTLSSRVNVLKWTTERAFTTPVRSVRARN